MRRSLVPAQPPAIVVQPAAQPVPLPAPQSQPDAEAQAEITRQIEALKLELEKSRAEMEALKARTAAKPAVPAPSSKPQPCRNTISKAPLVIGLPRALNLPRQLDSPRK